MNEFDMTPKDRRIIEDIEDFYEPFFVALEQKRIQRTRRIKWIRRGLVAVAVYGIYRYSQQDKDEI